MSHSGRAGRFVAWLLLLLPLGCGTVPLTLHYEPMGPALIRAGQGLRVRLEVTDSRAKKVLFRNVLGEGTESGAGSICRLTEPIAAVLGRALVQMRPVPRFAACPFGCAQPLRSRRRSRPSPPRASRAIVAGSGTTVKPTLASEVIRHSGVGPPLAAGS